MAREYDAFHSLTKEGVELEWITNSNSPEWIVKRELIIGPPKPENGLSREDLGSMGMTGFYRVKE